MYKKEFMNNKSIRISHNVMCLTYINTLIIIGSYIQTIDDFFRNLNYETTAYK